MLQSALFSNRITQNDVLFKINKRIRQLGDNILSNSKFGTTNKVDVLTHYNIKLLQPIITSFLDENNKCYLTLKNKQELLSKVYKVVSK